MYKGTEKELEERLEEMSKFHLNDKEEIWNGIEKELFPESNRKPKAKKKNRKWGVLVAAAAIIVLAFGMQTETGSAIVDKVKSMFEPEKDIIQSIEGIEEDTNLQLNEGKNADYVIYVDEERYVMNESETGDIIRPKEPLGEIYPEVSMVITEVKDKGAADVFTEVKDDILSEYPTVILVEQTTEPVQGYMLFAKKDGTDWDNELTKIYVIDNKVEGSFVIQQKYFAEAEEGHGVRFDEMLKEFHIVVTE